MGSPQAQTFTYDAADRLTSASASGGTGGNVGLESYSYQPETGVLSSKGGQALSYTAQVSCPEGSRSLPHAASAMGANTYSYDCNGNMTQRVIGGSTCNLAYDAENRLSTVSGAASASFEYDGDGVRVKSTVGGTTTVYIGSYFEWTGSSSTMKRYYEAGGSRMGMRQGSTLYWLVSDHLGSTSVTANASGSLYGRLLYKAWGEQRWSSGTTPTTYRYTGQRSESSLGLYYYGARWYDPGLARFVQADTFIPDPGNPMDWDRYVYSRNQPVKYVDPTGHWVETVLDIGFIVYDWYQINQEGWTLVNTVALVADVACAVIPIGTGGGPAVRAAMAGGDAVLTYTRAAAQVPDVIRAGQTAEKLFQFADTSDGIDSSPSNDSPTSNTPNLDNIFITQDKANQVVNRGWSLDSIRSVVSDPAFTRSTTDNPSIYNWANGNPVTYYYRSDGQYVVIDNITGQVVQVSNTFDPHWIDPMTNQEIHPNTPDNKR